MYKPIHLIFWLVKFHNLLNNDVHCKGNSFNLDKIFQGNYAVSMMSVYNTKWRKHQYIFVSISFQSIIIKIRKKHRDIIMF